MHKTPNQASNGGLFKKKKTIKVSLQDQKSLIKKRRFHLIALAPFLALSCYAGAAQTSSYPNKPVRLIVAYAPGGVTDSLTRLLSTELAKTLGQTVVVENRGGAGGTVGAAFVSKAAPDGYTLLVTSPPQIAVAPFLLDQLPFQPDKDFTTIGTFATTPNILVVNPSLPINTFSELVTYAKGPGQGKFSFASGGPGSTGQLYGQILNDATGMKMIDIPYGKSSSAAFPDVIAGRVDSNFGQLPGTIGYIRSEHVRPIVILSQQRSPILPDVPTIAEEGYPEASMEFWQGIEGPANMPPDVVATLSKALRSAMASPALVKSMESIGAQAYVTTPEEFAALRRRDIDGYGKLIQQMGLKSAK
ncbi:MAG: tripartite tricarboxylate transporter substrate binding protein [Pigmentiphaga sp.]|nr:tripartite tricarboxylate transporter substrate binding protein [Pigmentiphaga sp.]